MGEYPRRSCPSVRRRSSLAPGSRRLAAVGARAEPFENCGRTGAASSRSACSSPTAAAPRVASCTAPSTSARAQLGELYADMPDNTAGVDESALRRTQGRYAAVLRRYAPADRRLPRAGPRHRPLDRAGGRRSRRRDLYLFEPNRAVWPALEERFGAGRCRLSAEMDDYGDVPDGSVGMAAMIHVLDHVLDPVAAAGRLAASSRPAGCSRSSLMTSRRLMARALGAALAAVLPAAPAALPARHAQRGALSSGPGLEVVAQREDQQRLSRSPTSRSTRSPPPACHTTGCRAARARRVALKLGQRHHRRAPGRWKRRRAKLVDRSRPEPSRRPSAMPFISVVTACYNEEENVAEVVSPGPRGDGEPAAARRRTVHLRAPLHRQRLRRPHRRDPARHLRRGPARAR